MPVPSFLTRKPFRVFLLAAALLLASGAYAFLHLGTFLAREDALSKADAIFVLAGTLAERPLEGADLFNEGYAPRIVVSRGPTTRALVRLRELGIDAATEADVNLDILRTLGIPDSALVVPPDLHDNTAEEARTLRRLVDEHRWRRIIVVTSKYHLRRAGLAIRRALRGKDVEVLLRGSRYDEVVPAEWWTRRRDIRWLASEVPKLLAYKLGFGN